MGDSGRSTQTTTYTPSPLDQQKGETVNMLRSLLFPALTPEVSGAMTSRTQGGMESANKKGLASSVGQGLQKGDEGMLRNMASGKGGNSAALDMALQLYGYGGKGMASSNKKGTDSLASNVGAGLGLGGAIGNLGKEGYDMYKQYSDPYSTTPSNMNTASSVNSGPGYTQDPSFTGFQNGQATFSAAPEAFSLSPEAMGAIDAGIGAAGSAVGGSVGGTGATLAGAFGGAGAGTATGFTFADLVAMIAAA